VKFGSFWNDVVVPFYLFLTYPESPLHIGLNHGHFSAQSVDFNHFFEIRSEMVIVFLGVLVVNSRTIKVEFRVFFVEPKKLLFDLLIM